MKKTLGVVVVLTFLLGACGEPQASLSGRVESSVEPTRLIVYSGRSESLIGPLLERFELATGVETSVRYAGTAELAATLLEEGENSPADLFISQDAAALGALSRRGLFEELPAETLARVRAGHRSPSGDWVGLSGRARSVVFNTELISEEDLPATLEEVADPSYRGRFGVAPANASFQAHMAAYRVVRGESALAELLAGVAANDPQRYPKNSAIVEAVITGEIEFGLVNHYYLQRALTERPDAPAANAFMQSDGVSAFVNLAGVAAISQRPETVELIEFLLGEEAQRYFLEETHEYALTGGFEIVGEGAKALESGPIDFSRVSNVLEDTLRQIRESGLLE